MKKERQKSVRTFYRYHLKNDKEKCLVILVMWHYKEKREAGEKVKGKVPTAECHELNWRVSLNI